MTEHMPRVDRIINHPQFQDSLKKTEEWEKNRRFCRHGVEHLLDVARILWIFNLERELGWAKETLYAAALLHDIGRFVQYAGGEKHAGASSKLAVSILADCGFDGTEAAEIIAAISTHSDPGALAKGGLHALLYEADKQSRLCLFCQAETGCDWPETRKNKNLQY